MLEIRHIGIKTTRDTRAAYDDIYSKTGILHRDALYEWLIDLLQPNLGESLVDISCGQGRLVALALKRGLVAFGTDFSFGGVYRGHQVEPSAGWWVADGERISLQSASVDYVTHIGSLEHYMHPLDGAKEIARILKPNGKACILLPNAFGLMGNIRHVYRTGDIFDDRQPLQRYATRRVWENILVSAGLHVERVIGYGEVVSPRSTRDILWYLKRPNKVARLLISTITPLNLANHFVFICTSHP